jgi:hypothetical protein
LSDPVVELNGGGQIEIIFDALHSDGRLAYAIEHYEADWRQSMLTPIEYMDGFQGLTIDDFANAMATTRPYTNYRLLVPNDDVRLKVSGNYAVRIYPENEPETTLLTACFSVFEPLVDIVAEVTGNTMTDFNNEHQQVDFSIHPRNMLASYQLADWKVFVYQNRRRDNAVTGLVPTSVLRDRLTYERNRALIFEAGNEYRRIEFLSHAYNGMGVDHIRFHNPYYHVALQTDLPRRSYLYDEDWNGRFLVRCSRCDAPDTEADYDLVHFSLKSDPYPDGTVYLLSDIFHNLLNEKSRMEYNVDAGAYEKAVLLKQGHYNYQYLFVPNGSTRGETALMEGNYYQTENEYAIFVYFRPFGVRYDRLVGVARLRSAFAR